MSLENSGNNVRGRYVAYKIIHDQQGARFCCDFFAMEDDEFPFVVEVVGGKGVSQLVPFKKIGNRFVAAKKPTEIPPLVISDLEDLLSDRTK